MADKRYFTTLVAYNSGVGTAAESVAYDSQSRLSQITDSRGVTQYGYDDDGRNTRYTHYTHAAAGPLGPTGPAVSPVPTTSYETQGRWVAERLSACEIRSARNGSTGSR